MLNAFKGTLVGKETGMIVHGHGNGPGMLQIPGDNKHRHGLMIDGWAVGRRGALGTHGIGTHGHGTLLHHGVLGGDPPGHRGRQQ